MRRRSALSLTSTFAPVLVPLLPAALSPLDRLAREVFVLFPRCVRCGERIEDFEDADVRIFAFRVQHKMKCSASRAEA